MTEEEEATTGAGAFTCLEHLVAVGNDIKRLVDLSQRNIINCHQSLELVLLVADYLELAAEGHLLLLPTA